MNRSRIAGSIACIVLSAAWSRFLLCHSSTQLREALPTSIREKGRRRAERSSRRSRDPLPMLASLNPSFS